MARKIRYVPKPKTLVHVTSRTLQGRYLFLPGPQFNDIFLGTLGKAQRDCEVEINAVSVLSSHFHLLLTVDDAQQTANFMRSFKAKLAIEVNRLTGWEGTVFDRRYEMAVVTDEEGAQAGILKYVLSQSVKEQLVERLEDWPGVHSIRALLEGIPLTGHWFNRSQEQAARDRGEEFSRLRYATEETVILSKIPCWAHLSDEEYRRRIASLQEDIEAEAAVAREAAGTQVLGIEKILARDPQYRPQKLARSPAPLVHAATQAARKAFYEAYSWFVRAFRDAAEKLRRGDRMAPFPAGSFPPGLPFVAG
ncbi:MAG: transposase [Acidobacteria bacterium]|jgi:REP element-mobilizing transposase RayT|nr:transposase [Acidobacteriota bacterium]